MSEDAVEQLENLTRRLMPVFKQEDFAQAREIEQTLQSPGFAHINKLWADLRVALWDSARRMKNQDNVWRFMGVLEGHDKTVSILNEFVAMAHKEKAAEEHRKLVAEKEAQLEGEEFNA